MAAGQKSGVGGIAVLQTARRQRGKNLKGLLDSSHTFLVGENRQVFVIGDHCVKLVALRRVKVGLSVRSGTGMNYGARMYSTVDISMRVSILLRSLSFVSSLRFSISFQDEFIERASRQRSRKSKKIILDYIEHIVLEPLIVGQATLLSIDCFQLFRPVGQTLHCGEDPVRQILGPVRNLHDALGRHLGHVVHDGLHVKLTSIVQPLSVLARQNS